MYNPCAAMKGVLITIMDAQSVDETVSTVVVPGQGIKNHTFAVRTSAAVAGALQLESAPTPDYAGVWSPLGGGPIDLATINGGAAAGVLEIQFSNIILNAVRARISTVVAGGTVSVDYTGQ